MSKIQWHTAQTQQQISWPETAWGAFAQTYLTPFWTQGIHHFISNIDTELALLQDGDLLIPITLSHYDPTNSYVCSVFNHYFAYSFEELDKLESPLGEWFITQLLKPLSRYYQRRHFDDVILVNNWLLSTNLYPDLTPAQIERISDFHVKKFPNRPIVFRSVDAHGNPTLQETLTTLGYNMVFSRQIFYADGPNVWRKIDLKRDYKLYKKTNYRLVDHGDLTEADMPRLLDLYNQLYLDKYSHYNPKFTVPFLTHMWRHNLLHMTALRHPNGRLDGVMGAFQQSGFSTHPVFGYDLSVPQEEGLYRLLCTHVMVDAREKGLRPHNSSGVGKFKMTRGGTPVNEFNAVYTKHLPKSQQRPWHILKFILDKIAVPIIEYYEF